jgi:hypothetical protein
MVKIMIDGQKYEVVETLPYHSAGTPAKVVKDKTSHTGERVAVKRGGIYRFRTVQDRLSVMQVRVPSKKKR